ncbi:hypothetical protein BC938DRAFT_475894 [Jimgerdemannia flammicorona]|uniref:PB1 domain-containing protein n=1 Tax=Jimgerdemannia flammicorona TaxID=994334 RepID=A0A433PMS9_9FUNG|nr:hypothetical protein BC938DRAFT_475894 [Jimgerdemannia flammicorona]
MTVTSTAFNSFPLLYNHKKLRGNNIINYTQLGLNFRLYACEVLFNRGICHLYIGRIDAGLTDLYHAQKDKQTEEHDVIDQAVLDRGKGYSVFSIPPGVIYRPLESKLRNANTADYFASSKVMVPLEMGDQFAGGKNQRAPGGGLGRNNSVMLRTPGSQSQNIPQRRQMEQLPNGSPIHTIIPPKRMDSRERPNNTPPKNQGLYPSHGTPPRAQTPDGRAYTPDGRAYTPDGRLHNPDPRPYTSDPSYNQQGLSAPHPLRNQQSLSSTTNSGQNQLPPIPPKSTRRTSANNNNPQQQRRISDQPPPKGLAPTQGPIPSPSTSSGAIPPHSPLHPPYETDPADPFQRPRRSRDRDSLTREFQTSTTMPLHHHTPVSSSKSSHDTRRVDSGFESTHEERFSQTSRSSSGSGVGGRMPQRHSPPPLPPMPQRQEDWDRKQAPKTPRTPTVPQRQDSYDDDGAGGYYDDVEGMLDALKDISVTGEGGKSGKLKIKLRYGEDTRVLVVPSSIVFTELLQRVQEKFELSTPLRLGYRDDEETVLMIAHGDFQMAQAISRAKEKNAPASAFEKMELWCFDCGN